MNRSEISRPSVLNRPPLTNSINIYTYPKRFTNQSGKRNGDGGDGKDPSLNKYNLPETHKKEKIHKKTMLVDVVYIHNTPSL